MNATFRLGIARPAAGTWVFTGFHGLCTGPATNAGVTVIMQRIIGEVMGVDMFPHLVACPRGKRIELDHLVGIVPFHKPGIRTEGRLIAADTGDPGVVIGQELTLRNYLTDVATRIWVTLPQLIAVPKSLLRQ